MKWRRVGGRYGNYGGMFCSWILPVTFSKYRVQGAEKQTAMFDSDRHLPYQCLATITCMKRKGEERQRESHLLCLFASSLVSNCISLFPPFVFSVIAHSCFRAAFLMQLSEAPSMSAAALLLASPWRWCHTHSFPLSLPLDTGTPIKSVQHSVPSPLPAVACIRPTVHRAVSH